MGERPDQLFNLAQSADPFVGEMLDLAISNPFPDDPNLRENCLEEAAEALVDAGHAGDMEAALAEVRELEALVRLDPRDG